MPISQKANRNGVCLKLPTFAEAAEPQVAKVAALAALAAVVVAIGGTVGGEENKKSLNNL